MSAEDSGVAIEIKDEVLSDPDHEALALEIWRSLYQNVKEIQRGVFPAEPESLIEAVSSVVCPDLEPPACVDIARAFLWQLVIDAFGRGQEDDQSWAIREILAVTLRNKSNAGSREWTRAGGTDTGSNATARNVRRYFASTRRKTSRVAQITANTRNDNQNIEDRNVCRRLTKEVIGCLSDQEMRQQVLTNTVTKLREGNADPTAGATLIPTISAVARRFVDEYDLAPSTGTPVGADGSQDDDRDARLDGEALAANAEKVEHEHVKGKDAQGSTKPVDGSSSNWGKKWLIGGLVAGVAAVIFVVYGFSRGWDFSSPPTAADMISIENTTGSLAEALAMETPGDDLKWSWESRKVYWVPASSNWECLFDVEQCDGAKPKESEYRVPEWLEANAFPQYFPQHFKVTSKESGSTLTSFSGPIVKGANSDPSEPGFLYWIGPVGGAEGFGADFEIQMIDGARGILLPDGQIAEDNAGLTEGGSTKPGQNFVGNLAAGEGAWMEIGFLGEQDFVGEVVVDVTYGKDQGQLALPLDRFDHTGDGKIHWHGVPADKYLAVTNGTCKTDPNARFHSEEFSPCSIDDVKRLLAQYWE